MALVVEDGTVRDATPESYSSVADADTYIDRWHDDADWNGANTAQKERALLRATRLIDSYRYVGQRTDPDQALSWPRAWVGSIDGEIIASNEIPPAIRHAAIEAALRYVKGNDLFVDHDGGTVKREVKQVGDLRTETEFASPKRAGKTFQVIDALVRPYLQRSRGLQRGL